MQQGKSLGPTDQPPIPPLPERSGFPEDIGEEQEVALFAVSQDLQLRDVLAKAGMQRLGHLVEHQRDVRVCGKEAVDGGRQQGSRIRLAATRSGTPLIPSILAAQPMVTGVS